jgi:hypothetical protein
VSSIVDAVEVDVGPDESVDVPVDDSDVVDDFSEELDAPSSAAAMAGLLTIAAPIPSATASPPTLPMNRP